MVAAPPLRAVYSLTDTTPARTIWVYRNGDAFYLGRKFVINHRYMPNFEAFMIQLNEGVETPFGVRNVYTPRQGHSVLDLADLQQGGRYVVAGRERFKKLNYFSIGARKPQARKRDEVIRPVVHSNIQVPSKWQSFYNKPRNIHVFTNGDTLIKPMKILIPKYSLKNWNSVLGLINEKVKLRSGGIHRLYTLRGQLVHGSDDLEDNEYYVACGKEKFKALPYWNNSKVPENVQRCYSGSYVPQSKPQTKKFQVTRPQTRQPYIPKDVALLRPPHIEQFEQRRSVEVGRGDMTSVYFAKSKKASPERAPTTLSSDDGRSVYKAGRHRSETEGAKDIPEDQNMQVDIPVEQAPAETVQDEDVYYNAGTIGRKASTPFAQDEDVYSNVENIDEQASQPGQQRPKLEQKKVSSFKKLFGFLFGGSKKKDKEKLDVGPVSTTARRSSSMNDASGTSSLEQLLSSRRQSLTMLQNVSSRTDNKERDEIMDKEKLDVGPVSTTARRSSSMNDASRTSSLEQLLSSRRQSLTMPQKVSSRTDNKERDKIMGGTDSQEEEDTASRFLSENEPRNGHQQVSRVESVIVLPHEKEGVQETTGDSGSEAEKLSTDEQDKKKDTQGHSKRNKATNTYDYI